MVQPGRLTARVKHFSLNFVVFSSVLHRSHFLLRYGELEVKTPIRLSLFLLPPWSALSAKSAVQLRGLEPRL